MPLKDTMSAQGLSSEEIRDRGLKNLEFAKKLKKDPKAINEK